MSGYHPAAAGESLAAAAPDPAADRYEPGLARSVLRDLERVDPSSQPGGAFFSGLLAFVSLGALPLLLWHDRFRDFVDDERHRLRRFAEWVRLHSSRPETMDLRVAGEDLGTRPLLSGLSLVAMLGVIVLMIANLGGKGPPLAEVKAVTYQFRPDGPWEAPLTTRQFLYAAWNVGLIAAYLFHWMQVQAHAADVRRFVRYANRVFLAAGDVPGMPVPRFGLGFGFLWAVVGIALAAKGAWWGLALALGGAAQHRYVVAESARVRRALAARVREMSKLPPVDVGVDVATRCGGILRRCPHARCLALVPAAGARFCPRCGCNLDVAHERDDASVVA